MSGSNRPQSKRWKQSLKSALTSQDYELTFLRKELVRLHQEIENDRKLLLQEIELQQLARHSLNEAVKCIQQNSDLVLKVSVRSQEDVRGLQKQIRKGFKLLIDLVLDRPELSEFERQAIRTDTFFEHSSPHFIRPNKE